MRYLLPLVVLAGCGFLAAQEPTVVRLSRGFHPRSYLSYSPDGNFILYSEQYAHRRASQQILVGLRVMKADGTDDRALLPAHDREVQIQQHAAFAPDGKRLALSGGGNDTGNATLDTFVCEINEGKAAKLSKLVPGDGARVGEQPAWSPDGTMLVVANITGNGLFVVGADGKNRRSILQQGNHYTRYPAWSPDGRRIAFTSDRDGNSEIYTVRPDGSELTRVTNHPSIDSHPRWSPDGQWLAFVSYRAGTSDIWICRPDGQGLRNLTNHSAFDTHPAWSPDGKYIIFVSDRDGGFDIYRLTVPADLPLVAAKLPERTQLVQASARPDGLVSHFDFDEGDGPKLVDRVGPNHGTVVGAKWVKHGKGTALRFDGKSDHVTFPMHSSLSLAGSLTISVWIKLEESASNHYVVSKHGWNIYIGPDRVPRFETRTAASSEWDTLSAAQPIPARTWSHIAAVFDPKAQEMRLHLGGKLSSKKTRLDGAIGAVASYPLVLGRYGPSASQYLAGEMDELRIFARALLAEDIARQFERDQDTFR